MGRAGAEMGKDVRVSDGMSVSLGMEVGPGVFADGGAVRFQFARSGGPGGQNVNKVNTKAELWVAVGALRGMREDARLRLRELAGSRLTKEDEIHISAESQRSQEGNKQEALERLRELIVKAMHRPKARRKTRPSRASRMRRLEEKRRRGVVKEGRRGEGE